MVICDREINNITFGIYSAKEIRKLSCCEVKSEKISGPNTVYDERMGVLELDKKCQSCGNNSKRCPGHFGHIELNEHILNPLFAERYVPKFLDCFCKTCYRFILSQEQLSLWDIDLLKGEKRFIRITELLKDKNNICSRCGSIQPISKFKKKENYITQEYKEKKINIILTVDDIEKIFVNVSDDDVRLLGLDPSLIHPLNLIMMNLIVLPPCSRPYINTGGNTCDDDLTSHLIDIVKDNNNIKKVRESEKVDEKKLTEYISRLKFHISTFFVNDGGKAKRQRDNQPIKGIKERISGKEGHMRGNNMGKRTDQSARTVIGPNPMLKTGEMGVPKQVAEILTFPEPVTQFNHSRLSKMIENGEVNYVLEKYEKGGRIEHKRRNIKYATEKKGDRLLYGDIIVKDPNIPIYEDEDGKIDIKTEFLNDVTIVKTCEEKVEKNDRIIRNRKLVNFTRSKKRKYTLRIGDLVERHLQNGDVVLLNRQPTLHKGGMMAMKVNISNSMTFTMPLSVTKVYNADFDGDEMNIHAPQSYESRAELLYLSGVDQNIISPQSGKPIIVIVQDSLLGAYLMTKENKKIDRRIFQNICFCGGDRNGSLWNEEKFSRIKKVLRKFKKDDELYTTRNILSLAFPSDFYYSKGLKIYEGVIYEGVLDKTNLGSAHDGIIQMLYKEYGSRITLDFIDNIQFLTMGWLKIRGFSIGLEDCMMAGDVQEMKNETIKRTIAERYTKAQGIEATTQNDGIKEVRITAILSQAKDIGMKIAKEAMSETNNFLDTVNSGSKGDFFNIAQLTGLLGQQNLCGARVNPMLNHGRRTLPHYPFSGMTKKREYESKGFIESSFIEGLNPKEFYIHAMAGREGICDTVMGTASSGYTQRKIIKLTEDITISYTHGSIDKAGNIYQLVYGENGWDPSKIIKVNGKDGICNVKRIIERLNLKFENNFEDDF